ncbi:hypothetical protein LSAT2_013788, partial [Lamellibrachia satsuma]
MRSRIPQSCVETKNKRASTLGYRLKTGADLNTKKHKALMKCTYGMIHQIALSMLPGITVAYAKRLYANGITSMPMLMVKMTDLRDDFCFRNWLMRICGMPHKDAKTCQDSLKDWGKCRIQCCMHMCPSGIDYNVDDNDNNGEDDDNINDYNDD